MNPALELIQGFEDIGLRFSLAGDGSLKINVPKKITLTEQEVIQLRGLKPDIFLAISRNEVLV
jgi:hypothetical protein